MKFTNGYWLIREGYTIHNPESLHDWQKDSKSLIVYAPCKAVRHRGDTLNIPMLTIRYSSPMPGVIRVQQYHFKGERKRRPEGFINPEEVPVDILEDEEVLSLKSGDLMLKIPKKDKWSVNFYWRDKLLTRSGYRHLGYIVSDDKETFMREQLSLSVGECVYGLGERFTHFVKNGQQVDIWNEDGGTSTEQAYKNVPFYLTNRGYGVFVNHPECVSFEVGSEHVSKVQFSVQGEYLDYFIIGGQEPKEVLEKYTALTGRPALPPAWSFGLWLTTSFTTDYKEETVTHFVDGMLERDIPLQVFHFDCFWMKEFEWCNFEWDKEAFPEPEAMLKRLKDKGMKICVWINPYIAQKSKLFDEAMEKGYLLKRPNGDVWQWDLWQAGMGIVDFTNPDACNWYADKLRKLVDMGVDCFKTDFGERIPVDVVYHDGSDPQKMHNYYTYLYNKVVFEVLQEKKGEGEAVVFARSATAGSQKFPVHWGGDCEATYESMAESLRGGLSLALTGFGFWSHDIGGFEQKATPDLYKRWTVFGLLSSHSRLHGNSSYRVPWLFDEEAVDVMRYFTHLKYRLMPYLYAVACQAAERGIPMMRPMMLEFPDDRACDYLDRQYMLGDAILAAPIFSEDGEVSYYLPEGTWTHLLSGKKMAGGRWLRETYDYMSLPLFVRENTILPIGNSVSAADYDYADHITFQIYELQNGQTASATVYNTKGKKELEVTAKREGSTIKIAVQGATKPWHVLLVNIAGVEAVDNGRWEKRPMGIYVSPHEINKEVTVKIS
ncbi:alpha-D-xyloside xylohydrolase [Caldalkalibacillus uzonensis]|uniref:Alpha-D-xyloside xylohydrolase n=1 Tax=Caldalkalibacillus uzonensis TaxID=353224 RepID=A0ABU0CU77_9BACI|nr:alpha-xylosidase [Caldalkalibacillus uzonensis]MDQ0338582.1 alpha-D-xyloside xylohydrolase [Caldalkalibacillus uzonensis]